MIRLLVIVAIVAVVAFLVARVLKQVKRPSTGRDPESAPGQEAQARLVRCAQCGAFVPKSDAVAIPDGFRCGAGCAPKP